MMTTENSNSAGDVVGAEVLVIDKDPTVRDGVTQLFAGGDVHVTAVADAVAAAAALEQRFFSVVVVDLDTPSPGGGIATIGALAAAWPISAILALTPRRSFDDSIDAVRAGAIDVIVKSPDSVGYLRERIKRAATSSLARRRLRATLTEIGEFQEDFLKRFMEVERRAEELEARRAGRPLGVELTILVVAADPALEAAVGAALPAGTRSLIARSGGEALDRAGSETLHLALVSEALVDLPATMVVRTLKASQPDAVVVVFDGPRPGGTIAMVDGEARVPLSDRFDAIGDLTQRLPDLADVAHSRERDRRFFMGFRERHYELLRRLGNLKRRLATA